MGRVTITHITDDLDGTKNAEEVEFGFNGVSYVIDLNKKNKNALEKALKPYLDKARKASAGTGRRKAVTSTKQRRDLAAVRAWARDNDIQVSDRGRIASSVLAEYDAAQ